MRKTGKSGRSVARSNPCGTRNSSTMMVMMMARTPSLNASSRLVSIGLDTEMPLSLIANSYLSLYKTLRELLKRRNESLNVVRGLTIE